MAKSTTLEKEMAAPTEKAAPWLDLPEETALTPMLAQYAAVKQDYPECLLFYRMGDFYELFFRDAVLAAEALDITLTHRGKIEDRPVPMCGVPWHSHEGYLARLIETGFRVAICEQVEDPAEARKRGGVKALVKRDVVRVVTAGTLTEETLLEARRPNYLAALTQIRGDLALAWVDMAHGHLLCQSLKMPDLATALARLEPAELILPDSLAQETEIKAALTAFAGQLTPLPASRFDARNGEKRLCDLFKTATLEGFGQFSRVETAALGAVVDYLSLTQTGRLPRLAPPRQLSVSGIMEIDAATRRNLELTRKLDGSRKGSLLSCIDRTVTAAGGRLLAAHLAMPLLDKARLDERLSRVQILLDQPDLRRTCRSALSACPDGERALTRLSLERGGPRDLAALRESLSAAAEIARLVADVPELAELCPALTGFEAVITPLSQALAQDLPLLTRDGGFIRNGYHAALDDLRTAKSDSKRRMAQLQAKYAELTGISALKVKHNNVLGFFVEVSGRHGDAMMSGALAETFIHRQTLANAVRFTTTELADLERRANEADGQALAIELQLFADLAALCLKQAGRISACMEALSQIDVAASHAELARKGDFCRPQLTDDMDFEIMGGRHLVVEQALAQEADAPRFISNECDLSPDQRLWLLTGPNMAGKSTFLRQNALIAIMAQIGAFVPAESAKIGLVDRIFSRVGASDDLARGQSTFMVEMVETATILNHATARSLVILDEIGRGTATYDGLSIAWAVLEHLHERNKCRALFATHYHELTHLTARLAALSCHSMAVQEWQGEIVFLHRVEAGAAKSSYGIHVARLAGLPTAVIQRAEEVLATLEDEDRSSKTAQLAEDLPLFSTLAAQSGKLADSTATLSPQDTAILTRLKEANPDEMTAKEALDLLYALKG